MKIQAADLNAHHLGKTITIPTPEGMVTGVLDGINHQPTDVMFMGAHMRWSVVIELRNWGPRAFGQITEVEISD